jgi:hypothetical protein
MGAGLIKGNEYQNKSECSFLLGVYFDEELYDQIAQQSGNEAVVTLDNFIHILNNEEINEKHMAILYKISLIGTGIRRILMNGGIARQIVQILAHGNTRAIEYAIGTLRNFSLDAEFRDELLELSLQQDWIRYLQEHTSSDCDHSFGICEHLIAFLRNLSLDSMTIPILFNSGVLKICQTILGTFSLSEQDWDANTQQNLAGLLWNLVSHEDYLHAVYESEILSELLPFMEKGTVFTQLNITGIIFCLSVEKSIAVSLFQTPQLMQSLTTLFQSCVPPLVDSLDLQKSTSSSPPLTALSPPISIIQEHLTGIFLAFSLYPELRVPLYKSKLTPLLFAFLVNYSSPLCLSSSLSAHLDDFDEPLPTTSNSHPTLSQLSSQHCQDILLHLAQERSLRHPLCEEWKRLQLRPSLMSLLEASSLSFSEETKAPYAQRK